MIAVGIDVSKSKSTVAILSSDGEILAKPFSIRHVESDIDNLITYLRSLQDDVKVVMEATGHYHLPILKKLHDSDLFVCVMNPYLMKKYGDNEIRRGKTDKKDAMRMAYYALENLMLSRAILLWSRNILILSFCPASIISVLLQKL